MGNAADIPVTFRGRNLEILTNCIKGLIVTKEIPRSFTKRIQQLLASRLVRKKYWVRAADKAGLVRAAKWRKKSQKSITLIAPYSREAIDVLLTKQTPVNTTFFRIPLALAVIDEEIKKPACLEKITN